MRSKINPRFRKLFANLPVQIRKQAVKSFQQFQVDPGHPSLSFKQVHETKPIFSARVNDDIRVLGIRNPKDKIVWFWIGSHNEYDKLLKSL